MTLLGLAASNLARHPARTTMTFVSLVAAFLLFMLLQSISAAFTAGASVEGDNRLILDAKYSMSDNLPLSYLEQVRSIPGIVESSPVIWFGGYYRDPKQAFTTLAVEPRSYFAIYEEFAIQPDVLDRFATIRMGAVASATLAKRYGWKTGDRIVLRGDIWPQHDGEWNWEFELAGTFISSGGPLTDSLFLVRQDYFNDNVASWARDQVGFVALKVASASEGENIGGIIDALYENSADPTRTVSEDQYTRQFVSQLGDIGTMSSIIMAAVFFTLLLLTGNTASQTFRERVPDLAVMKTLGFTDRTVSLLVFTEISVLCVVGAVTGIALAFFMEPALTASLGGLLGKFSMDVSVAFIGLILSFVMALIIGIQPAWSARRLAIVEALRR